MAFKIDPDAVPLYKEIKLVHAAFKKAVKNKTADHVRLALVSVFGSACSGFTNYSGNLMREELTWRCPFVANSIGAVFNVSLTLHLDDDQNVSDVVMGDNWVYGALLPLGLKIDCHDEWKRTLLHIIDCVKRPEHTQHAMCNMWPEKILIEQLGWLPDADNPTAISAVSEYQSDVADHTMHAVNLEPSATKAHWPNLTPWLHAMQALAPPPKDCTVAVTLEDAAVDWEPWSTQLKGVYLAGLGLEATVLPAEFSTAADPYMV